MSWENAFVKEKSMFHELKLKKQLVFSFVMIFQLILEGFKTVYLAEKGETSSQLIKELFIIQFIRKKSD